MSCYPPPSCRAALEQASVLWPTRSRLSDGICGDPAHAARTSDHNPDARGIPHAFDLTHDPAAGCDAHRLAELLGERVLAGLERRVSYIISNGRILNPAIAPYWRPYTGTNPHTKHIHVSILRSALAESDTSPWWTESDHDMPLTDADFFVIGALMRTVIAEDVAPRLTRLERIGRRSRGIIRAIGRLLGMSSDDLAAAASGEPAALEYDEQLPPEADLEQLVNKAREAHRR